MGQKLRDDKIGVLSHGGGTITMAASTSNPAWLTIGGQQYKVTSNLSRTIATDLAMAANTLYMIFAVRNSGNTELRISTNFNSVGPAGFSSWKLVGAFYSDGSVSVGFGGFINIEGTPESPEIFGGTCRLNSSGGVLTKGTIQTDYTRWTRFGDKIRFIAAYKQNGAGSGGSGNYYCNPPLNINIDDTKWTGVNPFDMSRGSGYVGTSADGRICTTWNAGGQSIGLQYGTGGVTSTNVTVGAGTHAITNAQFSWAMDYMAAVSGWSNTPIKDL